MRAIAFAILAHLFWSIMDDTELMSGRYPHLEKTCVALFMLCMLSALVCAIMGW